MLGEPPRVILEWLGEAGRPVRGTETAGSAFSGSTTENLLTPFCSRGFLKPKPMRPLETRPGTQTQSEPRGRAQGKSWGEAQW